ncbi:RHE_PE00001 family protein [Agrobacterium tumefaciens]|uniref:RHE_PE00001 family protein n=1 Tax=Agrobacterium tumefaciens TaxID=358 RepID=UPI002242C8FF|nr:RHE_PE00001 family protein [Agrobacterium tumefaciens]MCW8060133.1 RHE_PE00001 family protein [Agrobacterium tumefaciens]
MIYDVAKIDLRELNSPAARAGEALARLDERISRSPIRDGFIERQNFADAIASLWVDGELVHLEDLVLHDARLDIRTPTHELTIAHSILRARRQISGHPPEWALSAVGLSRLRGRGVGDEPDPARPGQGRPSAEVDGHFPSDDGVDDFAEIDAVLARSTAVLNGSLAPRLPDERDPLVYDADWDEDERLEQWRMVVEGTCSLSPVLRGAILLDAWNAIEVLQHRTELGRQLVASLLRRDGTTPSHLPAFNVGLRSIRREQRHAKSRMARLLALLEAFTAAAELGMKEHDRILLARQQLDRQASAKRTNSNLSRLVDLVVARPVVSANLVAKELGVSPQGARLLAAQLPLREMTGRGRFRAWGIL